jgi:hypothetical protein
MAFNKLYWLLIIFALFGGGLLFSETVSVIIVETGIPEEAPIIESSRNWESGIMETFFEYGHIVSNAAMLRLNADQANPYPSEQVINLDDIRDGGAAFYVLAVLHYNEANGTDSVPSSIALRLIQLRSNKVLYEQQIDGSKIDIQNELKYAMQAAEALIPYVKKN